MPVGKSCNVYFVDLCDLCPLLGYSPLDSWNCDFRHFILLAHESLASASSFQWPRDILLCPPFGGQTGTRRFRSSFNLTKERSPTLFEQSGSLER